MLYKQIKKNWKYKNDQHGNWLDMGNGPVSGTSEAKHCEAKLLTELETGTEKIIEAQKMAACVHSKENHD